LLELRTEIDLDIAVVHVNHQLRGDESVGDEQFVRDTAGRLHLPFYCKRVDTLELKHSMGVSKQVAAREARYKFFEETRQLTSSNHVATGHQADDNAETVLFHALRGTGVRGLAGIPVSRTDGQIIRPLLFARRQRILSYAHERGIPFRNDSSNDSIAYSRNYLRHSVVPLLSAEMGQDITDSLNWLSKTMKGLSLSLDRLVDERLPQLVRFGDKRCELSLPTFVGEPEFLREGIVVRILRNLNVEPSNVKVEEILELCSKQTGHSLNLNGHIDVYKDRELLTFTQGTKLAEYSASISIGETYSGDWFSFSVGEPGPVPASYATDGNTEYVDGDKLVQPLEVRNWKPGDWFIPLGMNGRKKLSDFFNDVKVSPLEKTNVPVFASDDDIVWVCGKRLDNRYRVTGATRNAIKLTFSPTNTVVR